MASSNQRRPGRSNLFRMLRIAVWAAMALSLMAGLAVPPASAQSDAGQADYPFFPSSQTTPDGKKVSLDDYAINADCIRCHKEIGEQWKGSMHGAAAKDPVFLALYHLGRKETKGLTDRLCAGCHMSPMIVSGNGSAEDSRRMGTLVNEGVSCVVCHSISKSHLSSPEAQPANASFVTDPKGPIVGPHADRQCRVKGKETVKSDLMSKSEFCANCHGVVHPLNGFVIERTYEEWRSSIYAAKGIQCQDCHMQPVDNAIETGRNLTKPANPGRSAQVPVDSPSRDHVHTHNFIGGNAVLPKLLGAEKHSQMAMKMLQNAASLELMLPDKSDAGDIVQLRIKVNNETAGHNLPTSLVEVRQMWLDVQVTDAAGKELFRSGAVDKAGDIDPDAVMFHGVAADAEGNPTVKPWEMTRFLYFHTVPPKGYTLERYAFLVPPGTRGPIKVSATLRYRSFPQSVANLLLGDGAPTIPIVDMTSQVSSVRISASR